MFPSEAQQIKTILHSEWLRHSHGLGRGGSDEPEYRDDVLLGHSVPLGFAQPLLRGERTGIADRQERVKSPSPSAFAISEAEIEHELRRGTGFVDGKLRVYELYQSSPTPTEAIM